jgi:signal transduction histidine kinase
MGVLTIITMILTTVLAARYFEDPEAPTIISVTVVAILFLVIGNFIIEGFNKIAQANRMKTEFISIASHQLRTPLSVFKWTLDLVIRDMGDATKRAGIEQHEFDRLMGALSDSTERMARMVNALLDVSRIEAGTIVFDTQPFSLVDLTRQEVENFQEISEGMKVKILFDAPSSVRNIRADKLRIVMVIQNLIDNALRYTPGDGIITVGIQDDGGQYVKWSVTDQGMGIPTSDQKNIFSKFFRADNVQREKIVGSGIGLYIARSIIEKSGGRIGFESGEGKGSRFWFTLPVEVASLVSFGSQRVQRSSA